MPYKANTNRYQKLIYRRCGNSGLLLPPITLGLCIILVVENL